MSRTTKVLGFSVPPSMLEEVEQMAKEERRTKSELFREMLRVYRAYRKKHPEPDLDDAWVMKVIQEAQEEEKRNPMSGSGFLRLEKELQDYGEKQAKALGINEEDVDHIVYETRQAWKQRKRA